MQDITWPPLSPNGGAISVPSSVSTFTLSGSGPVDVVNSGLDTFQFPAQRVWWETNIRVFTYTKSKGGLESSLITNLRGSV